MTRRFTSSALGQDKACANPKLVFFVSEDWYFCSHRLPIARAAHAAGFDVHVITRVTNHGRILQNEGFTVHPLALNRGDRRVWRELPLLCRLAWLYWKLGPCIAHQVALKPVLYGSIVAIAAPGVRVVNALAGLGFLFTSRAAKESVAARLVNAVLGPVLRLKGRRVIVQNPDDREQLLGLGVPASHLHMIRGSGVDVTYYRPVPEPDGVPVAAMVSRLLWDKGVGEFVEAARVLRDRGVSVRIVLVGSVDPANPASIDEQQVLDWVSEGVVEWWGHTDDVRDVWARSHIAVLPSYREGLPKSLLEAAACGRPLVATTVTGCREVAVEGASALTVPARSAGELAIAIERLAGDAQLRRTLGANARALVEREFAVERVIEETLNVYEQLLSS
ncbi:MAG: glycosyltransferase family 4 protein [Chromatiales bacterium]|jgi:glycosyltransferase involved in cell wall biosynthesis|nr:glycosyltransferase family 4 protein [Chromatiales bacterium]